MKKNYLLPFGFKRIGMVMFIPFCALCLWLLLAEDGLEFNFFDVPALALCVEELFADLKIFQIIRTDPTNEIAMLGMIVSLCFIALSKERDEDEMTGQIRMQSFVWSFWVTAAVLVFGILFLYEFSFLYFAFAAIFLVFVLYILKFNLTMKSIRNENNEK